MLKYFFTITISLLFKDNNNKAIRCENRGSETAQPVVCDYLNNDR